MSCKGIGRKSWKATKRNTNLSAMVNRIPDGRVSNIKWLRDMRIAPTLPEDRQGVLGEAMVKAVEKRRLRALKRILERDDA